MKAMTNTIINSMMSNVVKYICAVVLLLGLSVNVWGAGPGGDYTLITSASSLSAGDAVILYDDANNVGVTGTSGTSATFCGVADKDNWIEYTVAKPNSSTLTLADWSILTAPKIYADEEGNKYKFTYSTSSGSSFGINSNGNLTIGTTRLAHDGEYIRFYESAGTALKVYKVGHPKTYEETCDGNLCINPDKLFMAGEWDGDPLIDAEFDSELFTVTTQYSSKNHYVYVECNETDLTFAIYDYDYNEIFGSNGYYTPGAGTDISRLKVKCWAKETGTFSATLHAYAYNVDGAGTHKHVTVPLTITVIEEERDCTPIAITKAGSPAGTVSNGSFTVSPSSQCENESVTLTPTPSTGYELSAWTITETATGDDITDFITFSGTNEFEMPDLAITINAAFTAKVYTIEFDDEGATTAADPDDGVYATYNSSELSDAITNPQKTGYTFAGWWSGDDGTGYEVINTSGVLNANVDGFTGAGGIWIKDDDVKLHAKWVRIHNLAISSVDNVTISATTPSVAEGSDEAVNYGTMVTLSKNSLTSGYYWGGWKVYKTGDTNTTVAVSNNQFTMPDYDVTVSAIIYPKAKLLTRCQNTVTYHYAGGTTSERVATGAHPTGYTPADCENKRFMGWTTSDVGSALTQVAPSMTDPTTVAVDGDLDYYAVYASPNGGKVTGIEKNLLDIINSGVWTVTDDVLSKADAYTSYTMGANVTYKPITRNSALYSVMEFTNPTSAAPPSVVTGKIRDLCAVQFEANTGGCQFTYNIYVSHDGSTWTQINTGKLTSSNAAIQSSKASLTVIDDYYVKIEIYKTSADGSHNVGIKNVNYFTKSRSVWYSDYSNGCDVAGAATLTYKDNDGTTTIGTPHAATPSVPEVYTVEAKAKAGYTFDYITVDGQTYAAGDKYLLAHDVDAVITWKENPTISGNVYATSANGVTVQASGSLTVRTTENKTGTLTIESDNSKFVPTITSGASPSGEPLNAVVTWRYTPNDANIADETATLTATINGASSTITVHGRSLPENFAIVAQTTAGKWIALPNNAANGATAGIEIAVDNVANPTKVVLAPANTTFNLRKGYDNSSSSDDVTRVRFCANTTDANTLYATGSDNTNVQVYAKWSSGPTSDGYQWTMSTTDNKNYILHNKTSNAERDLGLSGSNWGTYNAGVRTVCFLPVDAEVAESGATIEEWFPDKVRIHTSDVIESAKVAIGGIEGVSLSETTISGMGTNYYEITTASLQNYPGEELAIQYTTSSAVDYAIIYTIPLIIDETTSSSVIDKNYSNIDLIVRDGAVYTANHSTQVRNQYMNIWIYPTAKLIVPATKTLKASSLNLIGGIDWLGDGAGNYTLTKYAVPEFSLKGNLKDLAATPAPLTAATYYMRTDGNQYYLLAAPSTTTINASDIKRGNTETSLTLNDDLGLLKYDGARRSRGVAGSDNWIDANTLERGLGYWIAADPIDGETYSLLRMPMTIAESDQTVAVIAHAENASAAAVHKGWNFIANPFMTSVQTGALTFEGGATATNFVVTPDEENYTQSFYDTHLLVAEDYQLKPFKGYFVQVGTSGNLSFGASTRQAPARMAAQDTINEVLYTVTIAGGESKSGTMGFFIAPNYTDQYDIGFDFEWMPSAGQDAYALYNNTRLRYTALPAYLAKLAIPVAYTAREAGTYTWTLNAYTNGQDLEHVYLIDYELDVTHDLLTGPYEFTTAVQTENQTRFAIATEVGEHRAPTDVETVEEDSGGGPVKFIYHDKMYILNDNVIYDATGKRVKVVANGQKGGAL